MSFSGIYQPSFTHRVQVLSLTFHVCHDGRIARLLCCYCHPYSKYTVFSCEKYFFNFIYLFLLICYFFNFCCHRASFILAVKKKEYCLKGIIYRVEERLSDKGAEPIL